jgi:hypothetical protein
MCTMSTTKKQRVTLFVNPDVLRHARAQAILEDLTLTQIVEKALYSYLPEEIKIIKPKI